MTRTPSAIARYEREKAEQKALVCQALELRKSGYSFRRIAEAQGCSVRTANLRVKKAISKYVPEELVDETRRVELDRYDQITLMNFNLLSRAYDAGDVESFCKLQDRVNAVHDRRKKMIPIEVPTRLVIDQTVEQRTEQGQELADLFERAAQDVEDKIEWMRENTGS